MKWIGGGVFLHVFAYVNVCCLEVKGRTQAKGIWKLGTEEDIMT